MNRKITVMLVDDHAVVRAGYRLLLSQSSHIEIVREAERGEEACQYYAECKPDVVVMDLSMPGIGGLAAIRRIRTRDPEARILAFSVHDESVYAKRAMEAGATGYISKSCAPEILVEAVLAVARNERYIEREIAQRLAMQELTGQDVAANLQTLSAREFDVFCLLAQGRTPREIAGELHLSYKTTANYSSLIKSKLGVNTSAEMARLALQQGIFKD
ncbi:MAG: response regulator transcription factor [Proteobacteria bacterium]|nr:response regulator transcription factor [Pseudomonadota bacterium]